MLFDILVNNNILICKDNEFSFKYSYWIMYFAAHRMHHDENFCEYVFEDMRYASYPELIEFYTGIDRRRDDALKLLIRDISLTYKQLYDKCGFPEDMNPYDLAQWNPSPESISKMQENFEDNIQKSKLPNEIKDQFADRIYDYRKPYNQDIQTIVKEYLLELLTQEIKAGSRALRNSDYASPDTKKMLMKLIFDCWVLLTKVMLVISPILASKGEAMFEGSGFVLVGDFGDTDRKRFESIVKAIPDNIVLWFKEDIYSHKMGPLFF